MPFSANSPEGPVTLIGVTPESVESMRSRNRKEKVYKAKCCGAPLSIRIAEGKAPHFVHQVTPENCDVERRETPEHRRLKHLIAETAIRTYEFDVETEAREVDPVTGRALWQADVLVLMKRAAVAFEVQLSNADYEHMSERQARYKQSGVRGLWLVHTRKGFPQSKALPVFTLESTELGDWVDLETRWDFADTWRRTDEANWIELSDFIKAALNKQLKWAPFLNQPDTLLDADVGYEHIGTCNGCARTIVTADMSRLCVTSEVGYPDYLWTDGLGHGYRTKWHSKVVSAVWQKVSVDVDITFRSAANTCCWCRAPIESDTNARRVVGNLSAQLRLGDLPKPTFGTVEWDWLRRWFVMAH
jgi:hypothetical protein